MKLDINKPAYVLLYAAVTSFVFTALIIGFYAFAKPRIEYNKQQQLVRARKELFEDADFKPGPVITDPETGTTFALTLALDRSSVPELMGYIVPVSGVGFWARIDALLAVTPLPDTMQIKGIVFLSHQETPGLGGRITEKQWRDKFKGVDISSPDGDTYIHIGGEKPGHIDAITGATGTSSAVDRFLNQNIASFRRALAAHLEKQKGGTE